MNAVERQLVTTAASPGAVLDVYVSHNGQKLYESSPDTMAAFLEFAQGGDWVGARIGQGMTSSVYELHGLDLCVKKTDVLTLENIGRSLRGWEPLAPNLVHEAKFMNAVQKKLAKRPKNGVRAPKQFAAVRTPKGSASLQELIPRNYRTIEDLLRITRGQYETQEEIINRGNRAVRKTRRALGFSALRLGAGELGRPLFGSVNTRNVFLEIGSVHKDSKEVDAYVIDLVGPLAIQGLIAKSVAKIS